MKPDTQNRPNGREQKFAAILCAGAGFILFLFAMLLPLERYGEVIVKNVAARFWLLVVAGGLLQIALMCALTAIVVKALWFLPAREIRVDQAPANQNVSPAVAAPIAEAGSASIPSSNAGNGALIFGVLSVFIMLAFLMFIGLVAG